MYPWTVLTVALLINDTVADTANPIDAAIDIYRNTIAYQVTLRSISRGKTEIIRYYFKKPGYVRMEFVTPFSGAVLVYSPISKQAKLWPFGYRSFPGFTISPDNSLIQSSAGQRVDRSDVGVLYQNVKLLQDRGRTDLVAVEAINGQDSLHISVEGDQGFTVGTVARYQLWLDQTTGFPLKVLSQDARGQPIETVGMEGLKIDPEFPVDFFSQ